MKESIEAHAARFDEMAGDYDDRMDDEHRACADLVVRHANPDADDVVLDLGTGTGAIGLALAPDAKAVIGRDISEGMMDEARAKAADEGIENVSFGKGTFREPNVDDAGRIDVIVSNFAMHHLSDDEKREAIEVIAELSSASSRTPSGDIAGLGPKRFVLGDVMFFGAPDPEEPYCSPEVDEPATVGVLADALTDAGFALTAVEQVHEQVGVLVAERETRGEP